MTVPSPAEVARVSHPRFFVRGAPHQRSELQQLMGWEPARGVERLVDETCAWLRVHADQLAPILQATA